jgi:methyl-accepting chemotaxis protein
MTFRRSAPAALIAAVIIVIAGMTFISSQLFSGLTDSIEQSQFQLMQSIMQDALNQAQNKALARAELVAALPEAKKMVAAHDRAGLLAEYGPMFQIQKERHGVNQAQFHIAPAISLLRLQAPAKFGDDLSRNRPMVVTVNRVNASRKGFAIAASGPAIFGVAPVDDDAGKQVGSFEFGLDFGSLLVSLKNAYGFDFALFIEEAPLRQYGTSVDPEKLSDRNRVGRFIRYNTTNSAVMQDLVSEGDIVALDDVTSHYTRDSQGTPYGVLLVPLHNAAGDAIGVIAMARDFSGSRAAAGQSLVWQICLAIFAIVLLTGVIIVVIRGFLLRPLEVLTERFVADAEGGDVTLNENTDKFPREIRELIDLHEKMRASPEHALAEHKS